MSEVSSQGRNGGVFDGDLCVGATMYGGSFPMKITCWKNDVATPEIIDGYTPGHEIILKWYDASENIEAEFTTPPSTFSLDDPVAPTHSGFGLGAFGVRSFYYGVEGIQQLPKEFRLGQNYPNPFNPKTIIPLELPQRSKVRVELFNIKGQSLGTIYEGIQNAGWPKIHYNASSLASGLYFYRIVAEGQEKPCKFQSTGKMLLLK
jgi:hypothetical protein